MHYELDLMFGDSEAKARIFYHWAKCKIEREGSGEEHLNGEMESETGVNAVMGGN